MGNCGDSSEAVKPANPEQSKNNKAVQSSQNNKPVQNANTKSTQTQQPQQPQQTQKIQSNTKVIQNTATAKVQQPKKNQAPKLPPMVQLQLAKHNEYRKKHHAQPLVVSDWLMKRAQQWADNLAKTNQFQHSDCNLNGKSIGENIYWSSGNVKGGDATKAWYDEIKDYVYGKGQGTFDKTGHFSQVVWKASKQVGFGYKNGNVVANYYPAGNLMGSWESNVQKP